VSDFPSVKLHVVTGKGGTGKTTVAGALALALAAGGRQVLLTEVEGRQGIAQMFDTPPLPYEERKVAVAPAGYSGRSRSTPRLPSSNTSRSSTTSSAPAAR
jgi:Mrp family chromosome partitioning ATPase